MNTNTQFIVNDQSIELVRFPKQHPKSSLQAWDAADEYILNHIEALGLDAPLSMAIINDDFGALTCALAQYNPTVFSDSYMAHCGIRENLSRNKLPSISTYSAQDIAGQDTCFDVVIIKVPRTLALLEQQLIDLQNCIGPNTIVIGGAKVKMVTSNAIALFSKYIGETKTSLAVKKARLIFATAASSDNEAPVYQSPYPTLVTDPNVAFTLYNHANVFCREQLDIGARFLLKHLPNTSGHCIDLGCGNGVLGISLLQQNEQATVTFVDESFMAIESAKLTLQNALGEEAKQRAEFTLSHCLEQLIDANASKADLILCNPPFHQQNVVMDDIAWQMFTDAKKMLKPGGELRIVANRHLDYPEKLKRLFGGCKVVANNPKFIILSVFQNQ
ncbi:methyltransferase [Glaciecola sp. XM2]|uniref:methyltransferase n=1 Tax=Glaciecola sp. XM2 TaxID=1914931 RepID=UPI001BDE24E3|nr:methyltransferase [Glaciecola sp. XM2]MBT1450342.1 methyltransferase [Glaciecola sp. XM2]